MRLTIRLLSIALLGWLLVMAMSGCAVRTTFQGCAIRCPDLAKSPEQIRAEGVRQLAVAEALAMAPFRGGK